jgi:hypothetical protein
MSSSKSKSGGSRSGGGGGSGRGKQQMGQKDVLRMVEQELQQSGMEMPSDQGAREALVNGTRAYILAVAHDAVRGRNFVVSEP